MYWGLSNQPCEILRDNVAVDFVRVQDLHSEVQKISSVLPTYIATYLNPELPRDGQKKTSYRNTKKPAFPYERDFLHPSPDVPRLRIRLMVHRRLHQLRLEVGSLSIFKKVLYIPGVAGFLPSTKRMQKHQIWHLTQTFWRFRSHPTRKNAHLQQTSGLLCQSSSWPQIDHGWSTYPPPKRTTPQKIKVV